LTKQIGFVYKSIKTIKLVQASTIACSSSAMLEQHGSTSSTCSSRLARYVERVESFRVETWRAKWNLGFRRTMAYAISLVGLHQTCML